MARDLASQMMKKRERERDGYKKLAFLTFVLGILVGAAMVVTFWLVPCTNARNACEIAIGFSEVHNERLIREVTVLRSQQKGDGQ